MTDIEELGLTARERAALRRADGDGTPDDLTDDDVAVLWGLLSHRDEAVREATADVLYSAAWEFSAWGYNPALTGIVEPLAAALDDDAEAVRLHAARALGEIGDSEPEAVASVVRSLAATLDDESFHVRIEAAATLATLAALVPETVAPVVGSLLDTLEEDHPKARAHAAEGLGWVATTDTDVARMVAEPIIAAVDDEWWTVKKRAVRALGRIYGGPLLMTKPAHDALRGALHEDTESVQSAAAGALLRARVDGDSRTDALDRLRWLLTEREAPKFTASEIARIAEADPGAVIELVPVLLDTVDHPDEDVRYHVCRALGELGGADAAPALERRLDDDGLLVAQAAGEALDRIAARGGRPPEPTAAASESATTAGPTTPGSLPVESDAAADDRVTGGEDPSQSSGTAPGPADDAVDTDDPASRPVAEADPGAPDEPPTSLADLAALYAGLLEFARMESLRECCRRADDLRRFVASTPVDHEEYESVRGRVQRLAEKRLPSEVEARGETDPIVVGDDDLPRDALSERAPELHETIEDVTFAVRRCYLRAESD